MRLARLSLLLLASLASACDLANSLAGASGSINASFVVTRIEPPSSAPHQEVLVLGFGLSEQIVVTVGGVPAEAIRIIDPAKMVLTVPEGEQGLTEISFTHAGVTVSVPFMVSDGKRPVMYIPNGEPSDVCRGTQFYDAKGRLQEGQKDCAAEVDAFASVKSEAAGEGGQKIGPFAIALDGDIFGARAVEVTWDRLGGASFYSVAYARDADCQDVVVKAENVMSRRQVLELPEDGAFFACVTAHNDEGESLIAENNGLAFTVDTVAPRVTVAGLPTALSTTPNFSVQVGGDGATKFQYKYGPGDVTDCSQFTGYLAPQPVAVTASVNISTFPDGLFRFCALGIDAAGNAQSAPDATVVEWQADVQSPPVPQLSMAASKGFGILSFVVTFPANVSDYASTTVVGQSGLTAPACGAGATLGTAANFTQPLRVTATGAVGTAYSVRACAADAHGHVVSVALENQIFDDTLRVFVTSETYTGDLKSAYQGQTFSTGHTGADFRCNARAAAAGLGGRWKAILSSDFMDLNDWLNTEGEIFNMAPTPERMATSLTNFRSANPPVPIEYDEFGQEVGDEVVWTGTWGGGGFWVASHCSGWSSESSVNSGTGGYASYSGSSAYGWSTWDCSNAHHLYCLEQRPSPGLAFSANDATPGQIEVALDFPSDPSPFSTVTVRRASSAFDLGDCNTGTLVRTYDGSTTPFEDETFIDSTTGVTYYIACARDQNGDLLDFVASGMLMNGVKISRIFVTSEYFGANLASDYGGQSFASAEAGADYRCAAAAAGASTPLPGTWVAVVSTLANSAYTRTAAVGGNLIYNTSDQLVAAGHADLWDGNLSASINVTESGLSSYVTVWTGSYASGAAYNTCNNWTDGTGVYTGTVGYSGTTWSWWSYDWTAGCGSTYPLYCLDVAGQ